MSRPWFPFYVGDYMRDTGRLGTEAHGAYLLLMLDYWPNGAPPDDDQTLATITKMSLKAWKAMRPRLTGFFKIENGRWNHARIDKERALADEKHQKRVEAGGKGGKAKASAKQNPSNATTEEEALPYQPQPHSHPEPKRHSKSGESNSRSKALEVVEGGDEKPTPINETYDPSPRAVEYAYSLGMKKADLIAEQSKFVAFCMANRIKSFNPHMNFKIWCDRWLEHKLRRDPDWRPESTGALDTPASPQVFVVAGTLAAACWDRHSRESGGRGYPTATRRVDGSVQEGWYHPTEFPPGYDEQTGERLPSHSEDAA